MTNLTEQAAALAPHFKPGFIQRDRTIFQFEFAEGDAFYLDIHNDEFSFLEGHHGSPTLTLQMDSHQTCWGLLDGSIDGMQAFMENRYKADGNIVLSQMLLYLFKSTDPTIAYEIQY